MATGVKGRLWSVVSVNAANGSFRLGLPDNRHSVIPPSLPYWPLLICDAL